MRSMASAFLIVERFLGFLLFEAIIPLMLRLLSDFISLLIKFSKCLGGGRRLCRNQENFGIKCCAPARPSP